MARNLDDFIKLNFEKAIRNNDIQTYYQPVIRTASRQLCSFEALARWKDPELGMIYPDEFIHVLEKESIIHLLDSAVIRQVCARIRHSIAGGETPIPISVNLSRLDFTLCDIFSIADDIVSEYQIPHDYIYFEITESVMAEQMGLLKSIIGRFRSAGYQIWMDDFGSAYSSLNALKEISFDELKLDMCFLKPFTLCSKRIATAVVEMAKNIDIHTLVEGVENEEQFSYLRNIGCEKAQGFYFGKPMPYEDALAHVLKQGIQVELPQDRKYYDDIGRINFLSSVPFMTREEHDAITTARRLNSIPLALVEFSPQFFKVLFYNSAFEETADGTGMFPGVFNSETLCKPQPRQLLPDNIINLADSVNANGDGRMTLTVNEQFYEFKGRRMAHAHDRYCVLIQITNLTKDTQSENTAYLDKFAREIYALYERITLINLADDSIRPLYTGTREDLVSGRHGIKNLLSEYAEKYIYPDDRETYLRVFDPESVPESSAKSSTSSVSVFLRSSVRHGQYKWKEYTMLRIDGDKYFMLVRKAHRSVSALLRDKASGNDNLETYSPAHLWNDLTHSELLRIFWKDNDRRFLGASKAFLEYYGFESEKEIIGKTDEDLGWHVHPDLYKSYERKVLDEGITFHNLPGHCIMNGENREILASKTPLYDINGEIKGLIGYFIDKELLTENDRRGKDTSRRDILTGLLNSRGISEEAAFFRDEYYLRGTDFVRIHIAVNDFTALNEQYGFDFGDKILDALGNALIHDFGLTSAVGRYSGHKFVILHQVKDKDEASNLRKKIKAIGASIKDIDGIPVTLYLSVGYVLFSEVSDLEEQAKLCEVRFHADHDKNFSAESRFAHSSEIFHLFDKLPVPYSVYRVKYSETAGRYEAVIFYANRKYEELSGRSAKEVLWQGVRNLCPSIGAEWFEGIKRAALDGETAEGFFDFEGKRLRFTATQVICPGYCAVTYMEA